MYRTGGGPSNAPNFNDVEEKVLSFCSNIKGLEVRHDSDTITRPTLASEVVLLEEINSEDVAEQNCMLTEAKININQQLNSTQAEEISKLPDLDLDESLNLSINEEDNQSQQEYKWDRWQPKALRTMVSNVLKSDAASKSSVTSKLDKLSSSRLELVQLQMETTRKEQQFMQEKHTLQMLYLANDEKRKQEIHELLIRKINRGHVMDNMM